MADLFTSSLHLYFLACPGVAPSVVSLAAGRTGYAILHRLSLLEGDRSV